MYTMDFKQFVALFSLGRIWEIYTKYIYIQNIYFSCFTGQKKCNELPFNLGTIRYSHRTFLSTAWMTDCVRVDGAPYSSPLHLCGKFSSVLRWRSRSLLPRPSLEEDHCIDDERVHLTSNVSSTWFVIVNYYFGCDVTTAIWSTSIQKDT